MLRKSLVVAASLLAAARIATAQERKIIWECGQNVPNSAYWRKHARELEDMLPFDGVMLKIQYPVTEETLQIPGSGRLGRRVLGREEITEEMIKPFVQDMQAAGLTKRHHMILVWLGSPARRTLDYFDDALWEVIRNNIRVIAKAAREAGCGGLVFDPEQYGGDRCWGYEAVSRSTVVKPYQEYAAKARQRGREFGEALSQGYTDCTLLFFLAHGMVAADMKRRNEAGEKVTQEGLGHLYAPFLDGMLEGTSDGTIFVDGMEGAYSYATAEEFIAGRWTALHEALAVTGVPGLFRKKVRCGFGIWTDNRYDGFGWYPYDSGRNRFSPDRLQKAIYLALKYGDGYVWLWNERANWYVDGPDGTPHPPAVQQPQSSGVDPRYRTAVAEAKAWPGLDTRPPVAAEFASDKTLGYIYAAELERLLARSETVMDLPNEGWLFKPDLGYAGADEKWYLPETPVDDWKPIRIGEFWERQGFGYLDGPGWYRREIEFKDVPADKKLYLHFGAVDESCHLWIDGEYVAAYDRGVPGWNRPFAIEISGFISSAKHTLIIRAHDNRRMGGIWRPVALLAE